jgi:flavodoxin
VAALIVCVSASNGNTRRVADAMALEIGARVLEPEDVSPADLEMCDLVGFGSGVYYGALHRRLRDFVRRLPAVRDKRAFVFFTSGAPEPLLLSYAAPVRRMLARKGYEVVGTFSCRGHDTWLPLRLIGGIHRGRPNAGDFERARAFARGISRT